MKKRHLGPMVVKEAVSFTQPRRVLPGTNRGRPPAPAAAAGGWAAEGCGDLGEEPLGQTQLTIRLKPPQVSRSHCLVSQILCSCRLRRYLPSPAACRVGTPLCSSVGTRRPPPACQPCRGLIKHMSRSVQPAMDCIMYIFAPLFRTCISCTTTIFPYRSFPGSGLATRCYYGGHFHHLPTPVSRVPTIIRYRLISIQSSTPDTFDTRQHYRSWRECNELASTLLPVPSVTPLATCHASA